MDSITLENFISFCDDMQIANEGFKDTKLFTLLEKGWEFIKNAITRFLLKISTFIIKKRSKGDKVVVSEDFFKEFYNIEWKCEATNINNDKEKEIISKQIDSLLEKSAKPDNLKNYTIDISEIAKKLSDMTKELEPLKKEADKALTRVRLAKKKLDEANKTLSKTRSELDNSTIHNASDNIIRNHNASVDQLNKSYTYNDETSKLQEAKNMVYYFELCIKLYTGLLNKIAPRDNK